MSTQTVDAREYLGRWLLDLKTGRVFRATRFVFSLEHETQQLQGPTLEGQLFTAGAHLGVLSDVDNLILTAVFKKGE